MVAVRASAALLMLAGLALVPLFALQALGLPGPDLFHLATRGLSAAIDAVGWVGPQLKNSVRAHSGDDSAPHACAHA